MIKNKKSGENNLTQEGRVWHAKQNGVKQAGKKHRIEKAKNKENSRRCNRVKGEERNGEKSIIYLKSLKH